jgi:hypothetical protein
MKGKLLWAIALAGLLLLPTRFIVILTSYLYFDHPFDFYFNIAYAMGV